MPAGLHRIYGAHHLHFITNSCYHRWPLLDAPGARDRFLAILELTRQKYRFVVVGYVVMPEHIHLLITEPEVGTPSTVMQVLKQRTAHALLPKRRRADPRVPVAVGFGLVGAQPRVRTDCYGVISKITPLPDAPPEGVVPYTLPLPSRVTVA